MRHALPAIVASCVLLAASASARRRIGWQPRPRHDHRRHVTVPRAPLRAGESRAGRFLSRRGLPRGARVSGAVGDYFLRSRERLVVVRARDGMLVDLALAPRFEDRLGWGKIRVCDSRGAHPVLVHRVESVAGRRGAIRVRGVVGGGPRLDVTTTYRLDRTSGQLELSTTLVNRSSETRYRVRVCDHLGLANTPLQLPGRGQLQPGRARTVTARFCARREGARAYALIARHPLQLALSFGHPRGAYDPAIDARYAARDIAPGAKRTTRRLLVALRGTVASAVGTALRWAGTPLRRVAVTTSSPPPGSRIVVTRRPGKGPWLITRARARQLLRLPRGGAFAAALEVPGVGRGKPRPLPATGAPVALASPAAGVVVLKIADERGRPLAAKVRLERRGAQLFPLGWRGLLRSGDTLYAGATARVALAPGRYRATASHGFEHHLARRAFTVKRGRTTRVALRLRRAFATPGWIAADLHVHCSASFDSPVPPRARLRSAYATGVELIAATDHNAVSDYRAALVREQLVGRLTVLPGQEVTTKGHLFGHFNVFPLPARSSPLPWFQSTPARLFAAAKKAKALIQVNHPRMGSAGYFDQMGYGGGARSPHWRRGFQLLEIVNGDDLDRPANIERVLHDWYRLLARGVRVTATGGSDAHRLPVQDIGYPRSFILARPGSRGDADDLKAGRRAIVNALVKHRVVVSVGPWIDFSVDGKPVGSTVVARGRPVKLRFTVKAPPWVDLRRVELLRDGRPLRTFKVAGRRATRISRTVRLPPHKKNAWYVLVARGARPLPTQTRRVLPFALTNPIWVKVK